MILNTDPDYRINSAAALLEILKEGKLEKFRIKHYIIGLMRQILKDGYELIKQNAVKILP